MATTAAPVAITFVNRGGCGDPFFWASAADDAEAITIEVVDRSHADPVTVSFQLPDPSIRVSRLSGRDISPALCNDLHAASHRPDAAHPLRSGRDRSPTKL